MPTLALPPPPPPPLEIPSIAFFGRSLSEYTRAFALDVAALRGRDVLDVAAGPASFVAEACARRIQAVAVDPRYGDASDELAAQVQSDYDAMFARIRTRRNLFRLRASGFRSFADAEEDRRAAARRFLDDYAAHVPHGRYVAGSLPRLPFFDGTFDLVLCAHLLFTYAHHFDFDWHLAACRELVRVSAGEVRIHPICGLDGRPYPSLARLRRELQAAGIDSARVAIDYEFFAGSNAMLVLKSNSAPVLARTSSSEAPGISSSSRSRP